MKQSQFDQLIQRVAQQHNTCPSEVLHDMENCIAQSALTVEQSDNKEMQKLWNQIPKSGTIPTACEFISYISIIALLMLYNQDNS